MKLNQNERVAQRAVEVGYVNRNWALDVRPRLTRLARNVADLKTEGWGFRTEEVDGDCIYWLEKKPVPKTLTLI